MSIWGKHHLSTKQYVPVLLCRNQTANGGFEYWIEVNEERVNRPSIFVSSTVPAHEVFIQIMKKILS